MKVTEGDLSRILKGFKASGDPYYFFWRALRARFVLAGSNQTRFADQLGVDQSYLSRVLSGVKIPARKTLDKMASALGTTITGMQKEGETLAAADDKPTNTLRLVPTKPPGPDTGRDNVGVIDWEEYRGPSPKALEYIELQESGHKAIGDSPFCFDPLWLRGLGSPDKMRAYVVEDGSMEPAVPKNSTVIVDISVSRYVDDAIYLIELFGSGFLLRYKASAGENGRPALVGNDGRAFFTGAEQDPKFGLPLHNVKGAFT